MRFTMIVVAATFLFIACGEAETVPSGLNTDIGESPNAVEPELNVANLSEGEGPPAVERETTPDTARRPVRIGHDGPELDACGSVGQVTGLNRNGDNFLAVRERPDTSGAELDRLYPDQLVWMCENAENGWHGIVYDRGAGEGSAGNCDVGSPVENVRDYDGLCRSGWVSPRYITLIAG